MRRDGLAIDRLRRATVVTAEGEVVRASADEHPDLFWALRGGGGNFGVVTEFEFELAPFGPLVLAGMVLHPLEDAAAALRRSRAYMDDAPRELTVFETFITVPPAPPFPAHLQGRPALAIGIVYAGDLARGERVVAPLRGGAFELLGFMPPTAVGRMLDPTAPHGMRNHSRAHWLGALPDDAVDTLVSHHARVTSPMSIVVTARMGGAMDDVADGETAWGHRGVHRLLWVVASWFEGEDAEHVQWCRGVHAAMAPYASGGVYVNALNEEGGVRTAYADDVYARLATVKADWDPDNVFRLNQNIAPAQAPARTA
jgi:FAD/FMN-containing dehydrogenase